MQTTQVSAIQPSESKSVLELSEELIHLDPPADIEHLVQALCIVWTHNRSMPAEQLLEAIRTHPNLKCYHLTRILKQRNYGFRAELVCDILIKSNPTIEDLRFVFQHVIACRKRLATIIAEHPESTYTDLLYAHVCDDLEPGCRERLELRINEIRKTPASLLVQRIDLQNRRQ